MRDRLELFVTICRAVQHAHQKGVIHRDLKPSNVMVTLNDNRPVAKIIDFGVSKAVSQQLTEKTLFTAYGQMVGTPVYMSPEQAQMSGLDIDTRSDIYSLGVLLYEMLTGTTPLEAERLRGTAYAEMQRMIMEEESPKPSTRLSSLGEQLAMVADQRGTDPRGLGQILRGDMDWVVMKAIDKERSRRYDTASAFASDIERYLHDEPVEACPPSLTYKLRKFVRRNRGPAIAGVMIATTMLLGIIGTTTGLFHANHAVNVAQKAEADKQVALNVAKRERDAARLAEAELNKKNYFQLIRLAQLAMEKGFPADALDLLKDCPSEHINWEWHYLQRLACSERLESIRVELPDKVESCVWSPKSNHVAMAYLNDGSLYELEVSSQKIKSELVCNLQQGQFKLPGLDRSFQLRHLHFTPDGSHVAIPTNDEEYSLVNLNANARGVVAENIKGKTDYSALAFHPFEREVATIGRGKRVQIWDLDDDTLPRIDELDPHVSRACIEYSPDGRWIATAGAAGKPGKIRDARTGAVHCLLEGRHAPGTVMAFSHDSKRLVGGCRGQKIRIWDVATGQKQMELIGHTFAVTGVAFSPDDSRIISASIDRSIRLWNAETGKEVLTLRLRGPEPRRLSFSKNGNWLIAASDSKSLVLYDGTPGALREQPLKSYKHKSRVFDIAFAPGGRQITAGGEAGVWTMNLETDEVIVFRTMETEQESIKMGGTFDIAIHPNGLDIAAGPLGPKRVPIWNHTNGNFLQLLPITDEVKFSRHVAFSPDGRWLASGRPVAVWDLTELPSEPTNQIVSSSDVGDGHVCFSPCGRYLVVQHRGRVVLFNTKDFSSPQQGRELTNLKETTIHQGPSFRADGGIVACGDDDGNIILLSTENDKSDEVSRVTWKASNTALTSAIYSPDGEFVATAARDATIKVWHVATQRLVHAFVDESMVYCIAFSPNGQKLASGNDEGQVKVWDTSFLSR